MIKRIAVTSDQARQAVENGEFPEEMLTSSGRVVILMTQDWCPQWHSMEQWIYTLPLEQEIHVYEFIYNRSDVFFPFMGFKENQWKNYQIPYLRFYESGKLVKETNYIPQSKFVELVT